MVFPVLRDAAFCLCGGLLLALALAFLLRALLKAFLPPFRLSLIGKFSLCILFVCLLAQSVLLLGACRAKSYVGAVAGWATEALQTGGESLCHLSAVERLEWLQLRLGEAYPLLAPYCGKAAVADVLQENQGVALVQALSAGIRMVIDFYILRRALWMAALLVCGGCLMGLTRKPRAEIEHPEAADDYSQTFEF